MDPVVTILMPAYNSAPFISESVNAILRQSFKEFEFLIINDGSSDATGEIILTFQDPRIRYYENHKNLGLVNTLNMGLELARGKYILRTDADDIAMPGMILELVSFMESHPDYIICGGFMKVLGSDKLITYPVRNKELKIYTLNHCPFSHSTVIFRKKILEDHHLNYSRSFPDGEDYALWAQLLPYGKFFNLKKATLNYRESDSQITAKWEYTSNYNQARQRIFLLQSRIYFGLNEESGRLYAKLISGDSINSLMELDDIGKMWIKVQKENQNKNLFDKTGLSNFLFIKWHWLCYHSYSHGKEVFSIYLRYMFAGGNIFRLKSLLIHFIKVIKFI